MKRSWIWAAVAIIAVLIGVVYAISMPKTVSVTLPKEEIVPVRIRYEANVTALHRATVDPTVTGQVSMYTVKVGDMVKAGQVVAVLDTSGLQSQLSQLLGQLEEARAKEVHDPVVQSITPGAVSQGDVERARYMRDAGVITEREYETIAARARASTITVSGTKGASSVDTSGIEAAIARIQEQMAASQLVAPIDGKVAAIYNEEQKITLEGKPMMLLQQDTPVVATSAIPRGFAEVLGTAQDAVVKLVLGDQMIPGTVTYVEPSDGVSAMVKATFNVLPGQVTIGDFYPVVLETKEMAPALTIPKESIHTGDGGQFVYIVTSDGTVDVRSIETNDDDNGLAIVLNGLEMTDHVIVTNGDFALGERVQIQ